VKASLTKEDDVFISFQHDDVMQARGLRLMNANPNHKVSFRERSFIDPIKGKSEAAIEAEIKAEIDRCDAILVLVGKGTHNSDWVPKEVEYAIKEGIPVTAQTLPGKSSSKTPKCLTENGIAVEPWDPDRLNAQIHRAVKEARRARNLRDAPKEGGPC